MCALHASHLNQTSTPVTSRSLENSELAERFLTLAGCISQEDILAATVSFQGLHKNVSAIIAHALGSSEESVLRINVQGLDHLFQTTIRWFERTSERADAIREGVTHSLHFLARALQETMSLTRAIYQQSGSIEVDITRFITMAAEDPRLLSAYHIAPQHELTTIRSVSLTPSSPVPLKLETFNESRMISHQELPGSCVAYIAVGGGSDIIQSALAARILLSESNKDVGCLISVRESGGAFSIENAEYVSNGVYRIYKESRAAKFGTSGRFLENIPAEEFLTYLVIADDTAPLSHRINVALEHARILRDGRGPEIDTLIAVDTGGDSLMNAQTKSNEGRTTPDLDYRSLKAIQSLPYKNKMSLAIAVGIDSPDDVEGRLQRIGARCYDPARAQNSNAINLLLRSYKEWEMTGENPTRFGLTPLCLQAALNNQYNARYQVLPLPLDRVIDRKNTWHTQKFIDPAMRCFFYMDLAAHLKCIENT